MFKHLRRAAADQPDRIAVSNEDETITFGGLLREVEALQALFDASPHPPLVLTALPSGPRFTAVDLAALGNRAVIAPVPPRITEHEASSFLALVAPDLLVVNSLAAAVPIVRQLKQATSILTLDPTPSAELDERSVGSILSWDELLEGNKIRLEVRPSELPEGTIQIQFTSGSTDRPKGILISEENLNANQEICQDFISRLAGKDVFCPIPQFHAMGRAVVFEHLMSGSPIHLANRFFPGQDRERLRQHACAAILASPNYAQLLLRFRVLDPEHLPDLSDLVLGTAPVEPQLVEDLCAQLPQVDIHVRYGLSEGFGVLTRLNLRPGDGLDEPGLIGPPLPGVELAPGLPAPDSGEAKELRVRAGNVGLGQLLGHDEWQPLTDENGYLPTGDLACLHDDGHLQLRGRKSSFLKSNGYRINPFEIEAVLREIPEILEAVVVGVPDPLLGEKVVACTEPVPEEAAPEAASLKAHCEAHLSAYKVPREFHTMSPLPRTRSGKPDRRRITSLLAP